MLHSLDLTELYLGHCRIAKRLSARIVSIYAHELVRLSALCEAQTLALTDVQNVHIRRWTAASHASGLAAGTIALQLSSWRGFYKWLITEGHIQHNPCADVRPPKAAKPLPKALGVDAAVALADFKPATLPSSKNNDLRDALIVELLYGSGLRVSELVGLDITASTTAVQKDYGWIDAESCEVHVFGKGRKRRMVPLGRKSAKALALYLHIRPADALHRALLLNAKGNRLTRQDVWAFLKARSLAAGLAQSVHPHMLRHSFASHVLQSSGDLRAVQELLGHSSIVSTQVYTRLDFQHLAKIYDNAHPRAKLREAQSPALASNPFVRAADISPTSQGQTLKVSS